MRAGTVKQCLFGSALVNIRESLQISQYQLAKRTGIAEEYLNKLENCKIYEIRFDENFFTVNIDGEKETSEWKDFTYFDSNNEFITVEGKYSYMFPRKSMSEKEYSFLKQVLKKNISE